MNTFHERQAPMTRGRRLVLALASLVFASIAAGCPDGTTAATECSGAALVGLCPVGSSPELSASATAACGGQFDGNLTSGEAGADGQCTSNGQCQFVCKFAVPCSCGVETLDRDRIICSRCPDQSCGDGRCEGTERPSCEPGQEGCFPCVEDCGGSTCGDGDCTGNESPDTCPADCAKECLPNVTDCLGTVLRKCSADGRSSVSIDCAQSGMVCVEGQCKPGGCGNNVCEGATENPDTCPQDCGTICQPSTASCDGATRVVCSPNGKEVTRTECASLEMVCVAGECRPAGVCGNQLCEAGEDLERCAQDCAVVCGNERCETGEELSCARDCAVCGNHVCEANEQTGCPQDCPVCGNGKCEWAEEDRCPNDCTECGNSVCEAGELDTCPQDCGVCVPSSRQCLGTKLRVCAANGATYDDVDCAQFGQICAQGGCARPEVCGNGACEAGEEEACAADCTEVCGNGSCGVGEDFGRCAIDCPPVCGDGQCNGGEVRATCPVDCLSGCGDRACGGLEDRDNCPKDCGFCGDGKCQDGAESPKINPPSNLESCLVDCVSTGCTQDADCNDQVACTTNACVEGACSYVPVDSLCSQAQYAQRCIEFSGCCPDKDGDGFADQACGGSDCDDSDGDVHPGALEPCGGGDRNCNGSHKPALRPAKKVTDTFSLKSELAVARGSAGYLVAWTGVPENKNVVEYAIAGNNGGLTTAIATLSNATGIIAPRVIWSPQSGHYTLAYYDGATRVQHVATDGTLTLPTALSRAGDDYPIKRGLAWLGGTTFFGNDTLNRWYPNNCAGTRWALLSEADGFSVSSWASQCGAPLGNLTPAGDKLLVAYGNGLAKLDPADADSVVSVLSKATHTATSWRVVWDGTYAVSVGLDATGVWYERLFPNGYLESERQVTSKQLMPVDTMYVPGSGDTRGQVGLLLAEGQSNLYLAVRDDTGAETLPPGLVAGGTEVEDPHLFWDGTQFVLFWLAKPSNIEQVFYTTVSCE